jgi:hypothetical protein
MDFISSINPDLLAFYQTHAKPGRIGLIHLDFAPAKLVNWGQKGLTKDGKSSRWVHAFLFLKPRDNELWIAESDVNIPLPGFRKKAVDGPQENSIRKWSGHVVDQAAILDANLSPEQTEKALQRAKELLSEGYFYGPISLAGTWIAILKKDLRHHSLLHREKAMHCTRFTRECLRAAGRDPFGSNVRPENTAPELLFQTFKVVAEWKK